MIEVAFWVLILCHVWVALGWLAELWFWLFPEQPATPENVIDLDQWRDRHDG